MEVEALLEQLPATANACPHPARAERHRSVVCPRGTSRRGGIRAGPPCSSSRYRHFGGPRCGAASGRASRATVHAERVNAAAGQGASAHRIEGRAPTSIRHQSTWAYIGGDLQAIHDRPEALLPASVKLLDFVQPVTADGMHDINQEKRNRT